MGLGPDPLSIVQIGLVIEKSKEWRPESDLCGDDRTTKKRA